MVRGGRPEGEIHSAGPHQGQSLPQGWAMQEHCGNAKTLHSVREPGMPVIAM